MVSVARRVDEERAIRDEVGKESKGQIRKDPAHHSKTLSFSSQCGEKPLGNVRLESNMT